MLPVIAVGIDPEHTDWLEPIVLDAIAGITVIITTEDVLFAGHEEVTVRLNQVVCVKLLGL